MKPFIEVFLPWFLLGISGILVFLGIKLVAKFIPRAKGLDYELYSPYDSDSTIVNIISGILIVWFVVSCLAIIVVPSVFGGVYCASKKTVENNIQKVEYYESLDVVTFYDCKDAEDYNEGLKKVHFVTDETRKNLVRVNTPKVWAKFFEQSKMYSDTLEGGLLRLSESQKKLAETLDKLTK
jgi:hypothetical protein